MNSNLERIKTSYQGWMQTSRRKGILRAGERVGDTYPLPLLGVAQKTPWYTTVLDYMCHLVFLSCMVLPSFSAPNKHMHNILIIKLFAVGQGLLLASSVLGTNTFLYIYAFTCSLGIPENVQTCWSLISHITSVSGGLCLPTVPRILLISWYHLSS